MSANELRDALGVLDIGQTDLSRALGYNERAAQRWVKAGGDVPGAVAFVVKLMLARPELRALTGLVRNSPRGRKPRKLCVAHKPQTSPHKSVK